MDDSPRSSSFLQQRESSSSFHHHYPGGKRGSGSRLLSTVPTDESVTKNPPAMISVVNEDTAVSVINLCEIVVEEEERDQPNVRAISHNPARSGVIDLTMY